jgi:hypothetical protein
MKVKSSEREERLAKALRANLKRRKARPGMLKKKDQTPRPNNASKTG